MITSLRLVNFKNFVDETLRIGPFSVIVGANASGKSNIRDAFRFLHGIGRGYTLAEIIGGRHGAGGQVVWQPVRGAYNEIARLSETTRNRVRDFSLHVDLEFDDDQYYYEIAVRSNPRRIDGFRVIHEKLCDNSEVVFCTISSPNQRKHTVTVGQDDGTKISLSRTQPALSQLAIHPYNQRLPDKRMMPVFMMTVLESMRFMELSPEILRIPSIPGADIIGDSGQNLSAVLQTIYADFRNKEILTSWLRELTPMEIEHFEFPRDITGRVHLRIVESNGRGVSAASASDGTLRFLGLLAALLNRDSTSLYFFEEIDNGIHPARMALLVEMLERHTKDKMVQVITTTHSPEMLSLMSDETLENTSIMYRDECSTDSVIRRVSDLPDINELRRIQGLGRLHSTGWMEDALALEDYDGGALQE